MNKQYIQPSIEVIECELEGTILDLSGSARDLTWGGSGDEHDEVD